MKKPKTGESNLDCPGHNFGPIWPPSISNERRRSAQFGGGEKLSKSSLTAEQSVPYFGNQINMYEESKV